MTTKPKPPFRRGEWITGRNSLMGTRLARVTKCSRWDEPYSDWLVHHDGGGCYSDKEIRRATARELRAESNRLRLRANQLSEAADAIEQARNRVTEDSSGTAKGKGKQ